MLTLTKFQRLWSPLGEALYSFFLLSATLTQLRKALSQFPSHSSKYSRNRMHSSKPPGSTTYRKSPSTFMVSWFPLTCRKIRFHLYQNISISKQVAFLGIMHGRMVVKPEIQHHLEIWLAHSVSSIGTVWQFHLHHDQGYPQLEQVPITQAHHIYVHLFSVDIKGAQGNSAVAANLRNISNGPLFML